MSRPDAPTQIQPVKGVTPPKKSRSLPAKFLIQTVRFVWTTLWHQMMSQLAPRDASGAYIRPVSHFRNAIGATPTHLYPPARERYCLIVGWGCPWAHRTLVVRALKGLEDAIPIILVSPSPEDGGWVFQQAEEGCHKLAELYQLAESGYQGRSTVPVLWDRQTKTIVNNESSEIIVILNSAFNEFARYPELDLYPETQREKIDEWNEKIYHSVNNGVYRCGFAQSQTAYNQACETLFQTLDQIEHALANYPYLCGEHVTLADARLFTTLLRFDIVYYGLFKCNRKRIRDYQNLWAYLCNLYQLPGIAETCNLDAIKQEYYGNLFPLNPGGIIPAGPDMSELQLPGSRKS
jgi:glutathionyl-hydroquinone reductase